MDCTKVYKKYNIGKLILQQDGKVAFTSELKSVATNKINQSIYFRLYTLFNVSGKQLQNFELSSSRNQC